MQDLLTIDWSLVPAPIDDGATAHLPGRSLPPIELPSSDGETVNLSTLWGTTVIFVYPRMSNAVFPASKHWEKTPGAQGCTPQACAFRDSHHLLRACGASRLYGLSAQSVMEQREAAQRLKLTYPLLSDERLALVSALRLPTFNFEGATWFKRLTLIVRAKMIRHVIYPVFPPDRNPRAVARWLRKNR